MIKDKVIGEDKRQVYIKESTWVKWSYREQNGMMET